MGERPQHDVIEDESVHFTLFCNACGQGDPHSALTHLVIWLGACCRLVEANSVEQFARQLAADDLADHLTRLLSVSRRDSASWSGDELLDVVRRVRYRLIRHGTH